jgi:transposase
MHKAVPVITEDVESLKPRLQREHHGRKQPRRQMLSWLASGQAQTRQDVARLLGVHRNTIGHWLARSEAGGMAALLALYVPAGTPLSLPPEVLASSAHALQQPAGFASCAALRQWAQQTHHREVTYRTRYTIVRTRFKTELTVPRPSHTKNPTGRG